jgi:hypothetical protein
VTHVILERRFQPAISAGDVAAMAGAAFPCFDTHRVTWRDSFLAADGSRMVCWFEAPDAESARIALRESGADTRVLWPGTEHTGPGPGPARVVVERRFAAPVAVEDIQAMEDTGAWCLEAHRVTFVRTFFALDRRRMICLYHAPDAESVRLAQRQINMPVERVWACTPMNTA